MKKIIPLVASIILILIAGIFASAGTIALYSDVETSGENIFQGGTLDLKVGGKDDPDVKVVHVEISEGVGGIYPGWCSEYLWVPENTGSIDGKLSVEITDIVNKENGMNEPERAVDDTPGAGELGGEMLFLAAWIIYVDRPEPAPHAKLYLSTADGFNPKERGKVTLNDAGGKTYCNCAPLFGEPVTPIVHPGEKVWFYLRLYLPSDVGNIVQSDSVEFDIIFHLLQK